MALSAQVPPEVPEVSMMPEVVPSLPQLSFQGSYGDATSLPVKVLAADFQVWPVPAIGQSLVQLELTAVNETVQAPISGKLRVPLPLDATVCRFEFLRAGQWFPAVPVTAKKAKEVVYREKEKGRAVAATSQAQGNVFEIEVSPLNHGEPAKCRLLYTQAEATAGAVAASVDPSAAVTTTVHPAGAQEAQQVGAFSASACVGECFGQRHFVWHIPFVAAAPNATLKRLAVVWDTSRSQAGANHARRFQRLRQLETQCPGMLLDVWSLGVAAREEAKGVDVEAAISLLQGLQYDGATDLTLLPKLLEQVGPVDAGIFFSDGIDSLGRKVIPTAASSWPLHCVLDQAEGNMSALRCLSAATGGTLLSGDYLTILQPTTFLAEIVTDQSDEAFFDQNDAFTCCPDHRLQVKRAIGEKGLWICGTVGAVTRITAEVAAGGVRQQFLLDLNSAPKVQPGAERLLGFLFAREQYAAVQLDAAAMGADLGQISGDLALRYGFCSPESSLLMLYEAAQFFENEIPCPTDHPAHQEWRTQSNQKAPASCVGEPGQPKTEEQMGTVRRLADQLREFLAIVPRKEQPQRGEGAVLQAMCMSMSSEAMPEAMAAMACRMEECEAEEEMMVGGGGGGTWDDADLAGFADMAPPPPGAPAMAMDMAAPAMAMAAPVCLARMSAPCAAPAPPPPSANSASPSLRREAPERERRARRRVASNGGGSPRSMSRERERRDSGGDAPAAPGEGGVVKDMSLYVEGKEQAYLAELEAALRGGDWRPTFERLRQEHGSSPSFYLYTAGLLSASGHADDAVRVCSNCLEMGLPDVQLMRSVGYFLLKLGCASLATEVFDRVEQLAPAEPQSFLDGGLVRLLRLRQHFEEPLLRAAVRLVARSLSHAWADRFTEIEWPALVLLHLLVGFGESKGLADVWPAELVDPALRSADFHVGLVVWLGWDTDKTDIDLHVVEPSGNEVYYSNNRSGIGGWLSRDFTQGYGPEVYMVKAPVPGRYKVLAKYYASHQQSGLTGATSAVLWALQGSAAEGSIQFEMVRLDRHTEKMEVMRVEVAAGAAAAP